MASFLWIFVSCLLNLVGTEFTHEKCDTTDDKLYILADLTTDSSSSIRLVSDFVRIFDSYRNDTSKDLDVHLIEPFQEKSIQLDLYNNTAENIISALEDLETSNTFNTSIHADYLDLSKALNFTGQVIGDDTSRPDHVKGYIIAGFFTCESDCAAIVDSFKTRNNTFKEKQLILFLKAEYKALGRLYEEKFMYVHIYKPYSLNTFFKFLNLLCRECSPGWLSFKDNKNIFSNTCYKVFRSNTLMNWFDARNQCVRLSADLPVMETLEELTFVNTLLHNYNLEARSVHLEEDVIPVGLTNMNNSIKRFQWINGRPFLVLTTNVNVNSFPNPECGAFDYSKRNASKNVPALGDDDTIWVIGDCKRIKTRTIVCEKYIKNNFYFVNETVSNNNMRLINKIIESQNNEFMANNIIFGNVMFSMVNPVLVLWNYENFLNLMFPCGDGNFLFYHQVCDNEIHCQNGRDEEYCEKNSYDCLNFKNDRCNVFQVFSKSGDQEGCDECLGRRCSDGTCVPRHWLSRDQENCLLYNTRDGKHFLNVSENCIENCNFIDKFIHEIVICNSDNDLKSLTKFSNDLNIVSNITWAPKCLYIRGRSGNPLGCSDMTHLNDCENFQCPDTFFKCYKSYCISIYMMFDTIMDCTYGEDEHSVGYIVEYLYNCNFFHAFQTILHPLNVCDGIAQCPFGDDELNCNFKCPRGFSCLGSGIVVKNYSEIGVISSFEIFDIRSKYLNVSGIDLSHIKEAYVLPNLLDLQASYCNITNVDIIFGKFENYRIFNVNLSHNNILRLNSMGSLYYLKNLRFLSLASNTNLSILESKSFSESQLQTLDISFTNISVLNLDSMFSHNSLRYLNLFNTKINKIIGHVSGGIHLSFLDIRHTLLQQQAVADFLKLILIKDQLYTDNFIYCCPQIIGLKTPRHVCHAPSDGVSSCEDLLGDVLKRSLLWLVAIISICLNLIVLIFRTVYERGVFKKGYGVFITNLGVSDFIMGVYLLIIAAVDVNFRGSYVLYETAWRHSILCKTAGFLSTLSSETSTFFVALITLDRFLVIRFPFGEYRLTKWVIIFSVVLSWVFGFILALIPIAYQQWTIYSSNAMCLGLPLTTSRQQGWQYAVCVFIVLNCILFTCIALGQVSIFWSMSRKRMISNTASAARREQDITVAKQLFIIALSNFLCWFPICVMGLRSLNGYEASPDTYAWFVIFVLPLNAAVNPLIYTVPVLYKKWLQFKRGVDQ